VAATSRVGFRSRIGFGGSGLGTLYHDVSDDQAQDTLLTAYQGGLRYFDTAPYYGFGLSELRLGRFLRGVERDSFTISTKVGRYLTPPRGRPVAYGAWAKPLHLQPVFDYSYDGTMRAFEQSASRLGFSDFDILYIHDVDRYTHGQLYEARFAEAMEGCYRALHELRANGDIRAIGVGVNESEVAARFLREGDFDVALIAGRYTLLEQSALDALFPEALLRNVEIVAAGIFNSGVLAAPDTRKSTYDYAAVPAHIVERVSRIKAICAQYDVPVQAASLQFPLVHPAVSAVLIGMDQPGQVVDNLAWAGTPLPTTLWAALKQAGCIAATAPAPTEAGD